MIIHNYYHITGIFGGELKFGGLAVYSGWLRHGALACIVTKQPNTLIALEETVKMQHYDYTSTLLYIEESLLIT